MSPFRSRLLWKSFLAVLLGLALWFPIFYWLTVPMVNRLAYDVEEKAGRTVLDSVAQVVSQSHRDLQAWRQSSLDAHRRELKNIVLVVESWSREMEAAVAAGRLSRTEARRQLLERLRHVRYGSDDYVWAADYRSVFLSHPDGAFHNQDASGLRDREGRLIVAPMVEAARKSGEGYFSYRWGRLASGQEGEKLSYVRNFPAWQMVVGTGVYIDDVEQEVARRKEAMISDLRQHLRSVQVAGSGYVFVIDGKQKAVIHPDARLEGSYVGGQMDPATGKSLAEELMAAARSPDRTLFYQWRQAGEAGREGGGESRAKVAWVDYFPEYDWYLVASAYAEDLGRSGHTLSGRILIAFILGLVITAAISLVFIRSVTEPILRLAQVARRNVAGDLSAVSDIRRKDEIGMLAGAFNRMVARLKEQIGNLERRVAERTEELSALTGQLESRVEAQTAEIKASEAKFRGLLEQSLAGIFVIQGGEFRYVNSRLAEIHGFAEPAEIIGQVSPDRLVTPADRQRIAELRRHFLTGEMARWEMEIQGLRQDGSLLDLEISAGLIDYEGKPAVIGVVLDVTERKKIRKDLEQHREHLEEMVATRTGQLEAANQQLQAFTYAASHDLKAPLRGIQSFAFLLEKNYREQLAEEGTFFLKHIQRSASRMGELIEDLLAHAKLEQQVPDIRPINLAGAVRGILNERQEEILQKGAEIRLDGLTPAVVLAEPQGLAQALRNLVENALKYSDQTDHPIIEIGCRQQGGSCCLWVRDNGIGFDMAYHDRIFEIFRRLHSYEEYPGSGVGLALVKKAMERMQGRVWASSTPGQGTAFFLEFRLAEENCLDEAKPLLRAA